MEIQGILAKLNAVFWNMDRDEIDIAHEMLEILSDEQETIQFDAALKEAYRELSIWSRTEEETGPVLDAVQGLLGLKENTGGNNDEN